MAIVVHLGGNIFGTIGWHLEGKRGNTLGNSWGTFVESLGCTRRGHLGDKCVAFGGQSGDKWVTI